MVSPIPKENAKKMTLSQWKNAIYRYIHPDSSGISPCSGGAFQLSQVMEEIIKQEPLKFKNFIYELDIQRTSPFYINAILKGLASLDGYYETKENLIKYCLKINDKEFNHSIVELLSSLIDITGVHLSEYCIDLITQYIINPKYNDEWDNDDIDFVAINCTNGKASRLLQKIFSKDINFKDRFNIVFDKIDSLSLATKVAFIIPLYALYNADRDFALSVLERFIISDKKMLESKYVREFIGQNAFLENFEFYFDLLQKVDCDVPDVKKYIAGMFTHYSLHFEKAQDIALKYIHSEDTDYKIGVAEVFSQYADDKEIRLTKFYQETFIKLLEDNDNEVRRTCLRFLHKYNNPEALFSNPLFDLIVNSKFFLSFTHLIYELNANPININYLKEYKTIIKRFIDLKEKEDEVSVSNFEIANLFETILKVYELQEDSEMLDLIDKFLLLPVYSYRTKITEFERTF